MSFRTCGALFLILVLLAAPSVVEAQDEDGPGARLLSPVIDRFPIIETFLLVEDGSGNFIHGITADNVIIRENGIRISTDSFQQLNPGVQLVTAFNPGRSFAIRNSNGISRYDFLIEALLNWGSRRSGSTIDDLSLLVTNGPQISHVTDLEQWMAELDRIDREAARDMEPNLDLLSRAIDLASDTTARPGMGRSVLYITPPLEGNYNLPVENLITRANEEDIQINIWMVSSEDAFAPESAEQFIILTEQTGGSFFVFTGDNQIPDPETYLDNLRNIYHVEYQSSVRESGQHQVQVEVQTPEGNITTVPESFDVFIQAPDPAFIAPPLDVERISPDSSETLFNDITPISEYSPSQLEFETLVSFPDERVRPLVRTSLYVNDMLVDENTEAPFEHLTWDISDISDEASFRVRVEAEDSLGMIGSSLEQQVLIRVALPEESSLTWLYDNVLLISGFALFLIILTVFLILLIKGRIRPRLVGERGRKNRTGNGISDRKISNRDPERSQSLTKWMSNLHWPLRESNENTLATLNYFSEDDTPLNRLPIPITLKGATIGRDPNQCSIVLDDPSVESLHARIRMEGEKLFWITDLDSVAGTWVNYTPVPEDGTRLEHGFLVHIGAVCFRFLLREPVRVKKPTITYLKVE